MNKKRSTYATLQRKLSMGLLALFVLSIFPFGAVHHHLYVQATHRIHQTPGSEQSVYASDGSGYCQICHFHFIKEFLQAEETLLPCLRTTYTRFILEQIANLLVVVIQKSTRGPPTAC